MAGAASLIALAVGCSSAEMTDPAASPSSSIASESGAIVGGTNESGFPAIGALTVYSPQLGYLGAFCSATLIDPEWVLTAAHCLTGGGGFGQFIEPPTVAFFMGSDAVTDGPGQMPDGQLAQAVAFYVHPDYDNQYDNDIALMRLKVPVVGVEPMTIHESSLGASFIGEVLTYVGFGVNEPFYDPQTGEATGTGSGVKRKGQMEVVWVDPTVYYSQYGGQGVCFGDSGGPGLYNTDAGWRVVGVNSAVSGDPNETPCTQQAVQTRVDKYAEWVKATIANPPEITGCLLDSSMCACDDACQSDGACDDSVCPAPGSCAAAYTCLYECHSQACGEACFAAATPEAQAALSGLFQCLDSFCSNAGSQSAYEQCAYTTCGGEVAACFEPDGPTGPTCSDSYDCILECNNQSCASGCFEDAGPSVKSQLQALFGCYDDFCSNAGTQQEFSECATTQCAAEVDACFNGGHGLAACVPLLEGCPDGEACVPTRGGNAVCTPSAELGQDEPCDGTGDAGVECADGLVCASAGVGAFACTPLCGPGFDCQPGSTCVKGADGFPPGIGYCACVDADGDQVCAVDDCDDDNAALLHIEAEVCGDGIDNDCDGVVDDGCEPLGEGGEGGEVGEGGEGQGGESEGGELASGEEGATGSNGPNAIPSLDPLTGEPTVTVGGEGGSSGGCQASRGGAGGAPGSAAPVLFGLLGAFWLTRRRRFG